MSDEREVVKYPLGSVTITFPAEMREEIHVTLHALDYLLALKDLDEFLRGVVKYGHPEVVLDGEASPFPLDLNTVQYLRECIRAVMAEKGVSLEDIS